MGNFCFCNIVALHLCMGNFRSTKSVRSILNAFDKTNSALSVIDLVRRFREDMNKTTVYRVLERLEREGVLHSFSGVNGHKWFAKSQKANDTFKANDHTHFQCQDCGKSECLSVDITIPTVANKKIDSASLILVGQCEDCLS